MTGVQGDAAEGDGRGGKGQTKTDLYERWDTK